jgi:hypothetical protein
MGYTLGNADATIMIIPAATRGPGARNGQVGGLLVEHCLAVVVGPDAFGCDESPEVGLLRARCVEGSPSRSEPLAGGDAGRWVHRLIHAPAHGREHAIDTAAAKVFDHAAMEPGEPLGGVIDERSHRRRAFGLIELTTVVSADVPSVSRLSVR